MKRVAILGSTGSIGRNTLDVIARFPDEFSVFALTTNSDTAALSRQAAHFRPERIGVGDAAAADKLAASNRRLTKKLFIGQSGLAELVQSDSIDMVVVAISGMAALRPLLAAIEAGKSVALANKEALVVAGSIVMKLAADKGVRIIPIDSEQSAIWQCLENQDRRNLKYIHLTASGGPFLNKPQHLIKKAAVREVLDHPRWDMGRKITVDSATMMNKGLELMEAMSLFGVGTDMVKVLIHPEAVIHSMVEFRDGVVMAQLSATDMRIPIQYALSYPRRFDNCLPRLDFYKLNDLHFEKPDVKKFPCLGLAYEASRAQGTLPAILNAANETAVDGFLGRKIDFGRIAGIIEKIMSRHRNISDPKLADIFEADAWARRQADTIIGKGK